MKFKIKEIVFLAIMSGLLLLFSGLVAPIVMTSTQLGMPQFAMSILFGIFITIALRKVPKIGSVLIMGIITGLVLLFMSPIMFFNQFVGALIVEIIVYLIYKNEKNKKAITLSAILYPLVTIPITGIINIFAKGRTIGKQIGDVKIFILILLGTVVLSYIGTIIGHKIADELKKAGKL